MKCKTGDARQPLLFTEPNPTGESTTMIKKSENSRICINQKQYFQLCEGLKTHVDALDQGRMNTTRAAEYLSGRLGFTVTRRHVESASDATGVNWTRPNKGQGKTINKNREMIRKLEGDLVATSRKLDQVIDACYLLFHKLGEKLPRDFPTTRPPVTNGVVTFPKI